MSESMDEVFTWSLEETSRRLRARDISAVDLTSQYLRRIDAWNSHLAAYVTVMHDEALRDAREADKAIAGDTMRGPLHGIPVAIKDNIPVRGCPTTVGSRLLLYEQDHDAAVVQRLRAAGAVVLGKAHLTELALGSFHPEFPPVRNPWNLAHSAEGSSAGAAAAVAARLCLAAIGSDAGGSIRRPAAHCGIVGLKPTHGLVDTHGLLLSTWSMEHLGPLARTVTDTYLTLQTILAPDQRGHFTRFDHPAQIIRRWQASGRMPILGIITESLDDVRDAEWEHAFHEALAVFRSLGITVREVSVPAVAHAGTALITIILVEMASALGVFLDSVSGSLGEEARFWMELGRRIPGVAYVDAHRLRQQLIDELSAALHDIDVLIGPVTQMTAPTIAQVTRTWSGEGELNLGTQVAPTAPYNLAGMPALSLPCGLSSMSLPLGMQLATLRWHEEILLATAWLYEQATGWRDVPLALGDSE